MYAVAVPDPAMAAEKYHHADRIVQSLKHFPLAPVGLPAIDWNVV